MLHAPSLTFTLGFFLLASPASVLASSDGEPPVPPGTYRAVSESHWDLVIFLDSDGSATIITGYCAPGGDPCTSDTTNATWKQDGRFVLLSYAGVTDRLEFHPRLSLSELAKEGSLPGLSARRSSNPASLMRDTSLWDWSANE